ncbi:MAG TPA: LysE family transporter [Vicinamibacterales bacterium]|nr:LysE family transporter [Vicinamibacterales bacterium]
MFDARYAAFAALSALLVISPGATLAVVVETALGYGRRAALLTVLGVGLANGALASAAALGLSVLVDRWPSSLGVVRVAGGAYLAYLGARGLWRALSPARRPAAASEPGPGAGADSAPRRSAGNETGPGPVSFVARGVLTNLLNPPVLLFYMTVVPQFIGPQDAYLARAAVLGATHVAMSVVWQGSCGLAVGMAAEHMRRPAVRRALEGVTGAVLVLLGARLLL